MTSTPGCSIFQKLAAYQLTHPTFTFQNFGELVGTVMPTASVGQPQGNLCGGAGPAGPGSNPLGDPQYPSQVELTPDDRTRSAEFLKNRHFRHCPAIRVARLVQNHHLTHQRSAHPGLPGENRPWK